MKLYIAQIDGDGVAGKAFAIYGEDGTKLKGVVSATVRHNYADAARIDLELVVNGTDIVFGMPPEAKEEPFDVSRHLQHPVR